MARYGDGCRLQRPPSEITSAGWPMPFVAGWREWPDERKASMVNDLAQLRAELLAIRDRAATISRTVNPDDYLPLADTARRGSKARAAAPAGDEVAWRYERGLPPC